MKLKLLLIEMLENAIEGIALLLAAGALYGAHLSFGAALLPWLDTVLMLLALLAAVGWFLFTLGPVGRRLSRWLRNYRIKLQESVEEAKKEES